MPEFEPFAVEDFEWKSGAEAEEENDEVENEKPMRDLKRKPDRLAELAYEILCRAKHDFVKALVIVSSIEKVRAFYDALRDALADETTHVLGLQDLGYIDSGGNSLNLPPAEFLDAWKAKPRGVLISAQMLLEGFDDPLIIFSTFSNTKHILKLLVLCRQEALRDS